MRKQFLITGGTGSLGRELVLRLLRDEPDAELAILARAPDRGAIDAKRHELLEFLAAYGAPCAGARVKLVPGDLKRSDLGIASAQAQRLRRDVTHIVHAAARIHLGQSLAEAREVNVIGTHEVLKFAERCARLERLTYVSTAFVAGTRQGTILEEELDCGQRFLNAYEQSKWEAEMLVSLRRGRFPLTIVRPAIIVGDSKDGHTRCFGTVYHPLHLIVRGAIRDVPGTSTTRLDLVPVDYVADCVAALCRAAGAATATYHVTAGAEFSIPVGELIDAALSHFGRPDGAAPRFVPPQPASGRRHGELGHFFAYLRGYKNFDSSSLRRDLGNDRPRCPDPREYLPALFRYCAATRWGRELPLFAVSRRRAA